MKLLVHRRGDGVHLLMEVSPPVARQVTVSRGGVEIQPGKNYSLFLRTREQNTAQKLYFTAVGKAPLAKSLLKRAHKHTAGE